MYKYSKGNITPHHVEKMSNIVVVLSLFFGSKLLLPGFYIIGVSCKHIHMYRCVCALKYV